MEADLLRSAYTGVRPGYHMNKTHWNTVYLESERAGGGAAAHDGGKLRPHLPRRPKGNPAPDPSNLQGLAQAVSPLKRPPFFP